MQREEAASSAFGLGQTNVPGHVHGPEDDEDQFDDEDEEDDYDSAEDEDDGYNEEMVLINVGMEKNMLILRRRH